MKGSFESAQFVSQQALLGFVHKQFIINNKCTWYELSMIESVLVDKLSLLWSVNDTAEFVIYDN